MQLMHAFDKQSRAFQAVSLVKSVHQRNIADAASPLALRELRAQLTEGVAAMGHGVLLFGQGLGQGAAVFEHVRKEQRVVSEAVTPSLLAADASLYRAARDRFGSVLVDEHERAHEATRALLVGYVGQFSKQLGVVRRVVARLARVARRWLIVAWKYRLEMAS